MKDMGEVKKPASRLDAELLQASSRLTIYGLLEDKSDEYRQAFLAGWCYCADEVLALMKLMWQS